MNPKTVILSTWGLNSAFTPSGPELYWTVYPIFRTNTDTDRGGGWYFGIFASRPPLKTTEAPGVDFRISTTLKISLHLQILCWENWTNFMFYILFYTVLCIGYTVNFRLRNSVYPLHCMFYDGCCIMTYDHSIMYQCTSYIEQCTLYNTYYIILTLWVSIIQDINHQMFVLGM